MLKVLIVDDEAVVRRGIVLGMDWASMDCVVVGEAANGEEGLAAAERYNPSLIITDVRMPPGMSNDGLRAALDLKTEFPALGMLVVSQYVAPLYAQELFGLPTPAGAGGAGGVEDAVV